MPRTLTKNQIAEIQGAIPDPDDYALVNTTFQIHRGLFELAYRRTLEVRGYKLADPPASTDGSMAQQATWRPCQPTRGRFQRYVETPGQVMARTELPVRVITAAKVFAYRTIRREFEDEDDEDVAYNSWACFDFDRYRDVPENWRANRNTKIQRGTDGLITYAPFKTQVSSRVDTAVETSFCDDPVKGKIIGKKGFRSTRTTSGPGRNNTTVLLATNACGDKLPPLIIFQGKYLWTQWLYANENVKTAYAVSDKGWMETTISEKYVREVFVPATKDERPLLLIFDGHSTHVDLSVIEYVASDGLTIVKLPAHSSHVLQPLDCSTMKPLKDKWEDVVIKWQRLNIGLKLPKPEFARILTNIWNEINPVIIQNGFRRTGAYPVDRNAIPKQLFDSLKWEKWEASQTQKKTDICNSSSRICTFNSYNSFQRTTP